MQLKLSHLMLKKFSLVFFFLLITLYGCIAKSERNLQQLMPLSTFTQADVDNDEIADIYTFKYASTKIDVANTSVFVTRLIYVYPDEVIITPKQQILDNDTVKKLKEDVTSLNEEIIKADVSCKAAYEPVFCNDEQSCEKSCISNVCRDEKYGLLLLDYSNLMKKRDEELKKVLLLIQLVKETDNLKDISLALTNLQIFLEAMKNHPLVNHVKLCSFSLNNEKILPYLGRITTSSYNALVLTEVTSQNVVGTNVDFASTEKIDPRVEMNIRNYKLSNNVKRVSITPVILKNEDLKFNKDQKIYFTYLVSGPLKKESTPYELWNNIDTETKVVTVDLSYLDSTLSVLNNVYTSLLPSTRLVKLSIALSFFSIIFLIIILKEIIFYSFKLTILLRQKKPFIYSLKRAFGFSSLTWVNDAIIGVVAIIIAYFVEVSFTKSLPLDKISFSSLSSFVNSDPLSIVSIGFYVLGFTFLTFSVIDRFKRLLAGKEYDEAVEIPTPEKNLKLFEMLKEEINKTKQVLDKAASMEMDVGQQLSQLLSIPLENIKNEIFTNPNQKEVKDRIIGYINSVISLRDSVSQKMQLAQERKEEWMRYIDEKLEKSDQVPLDALVAIPLEWRFWAAKEYVKLHPEKFSSLEGVLLVKKKLSEEERAKAFIDELIKGFEEKVSLLVIIKEGKILAHFISNEKKSLIKNLVLLINEGISLLSFDEIMISMNKNSLITKDLAGKRVIIMANKDVIDSILTKADKNKEMIK